MQDNKTLRYYITGVILMFGSYLESLVAEPQKYENESMQYLMSLSIEELLNVEVAVASLFKESDLNVASSVAAITEKQWRSQGVRKTFDALRYTPGTFVSQGAQGRYTPTFRGFADINAFRGFSLLFFKLFV